MKIIKNLTFAALTTVAVLVTTLLFQPSTMQAGDHGRRGGDHGRGDRDHRDARATFTKWVTAFPNQPGEIANFGGVVGGDVGNGTFTGEVLLFNPGATARTSVTSWPFTASMARNIPSPRWSMSYRQVPASARRP